VQDRKWVSIVFFSIISQDWQAMLHLFVFSGTFVCTKVACIKSYDYNTMDFVGLCYVANDMELVEKCKNMMFSNWIPNLGMWVLSWVKPYTSISHQLNFMLFFVCLCYLGSKLIVWTKVNFEFPFSQFWIHSIFFGRGWNKLGDLVKRL
jgi:hypothetical protein